MTEPQPPSGQSVVHGRAAAPDQARAHGAPPVVIESYHVAKRRRTRGAIVTALFAVVMVLAVVFVVFRPGSGGGDSTDTAAAYGPSWSPGQSGAPEPSGAAGPSAPSTSSASSAADTKMPGKLAGWKQTFADDFTSNLSKNWYTYDGQPGGDPGGWFASNHVSLQHGMLVIDAYKQSTPKGTLYATGGVGSKHAQTYGRFMVRFRADEGFGIAYTLQLWPDDDKWPPEIDFAEDNGRGRTMTSATLHYNANDRHIHAETHNDFTKWHVAEVDWEPNKVTYLIDGKVWTSMTSHIPNKPMRLALQTQAWDCGRSWEACPNSTTPAHVKFYVDWAVAYSKS